jgi:hypothetical protein
MKKVGVLFGNRTELWWDHPVISSFEWKRAVWDIPKEEYIRTHNEVVGVPNKSRTAYMEPYIIPIDMPVPPNAFA